MTSGLTPAYDRDISQVVLEGLPAGPAGEAALVPVPGFQLAFDRADGRLSRVVLDAGPQGCPTEAVAALLTALFGQQAPAAVQDAVTRPAAGRPLVPDERLSALWSRLARLDAARGTSPVSNLPLWATEAAQLAKQAGLHDRAQAEARRAIGGADPFDDGLPSGAFPVPSDAAAQPSPGGDQERGLQWSLDPGLLPQGVFRPGLSPLLDLFVHAGNGAGAQSAGEGQDRVIVAAALIPGADRKALSRCRARLVDPAARRILASAPFTDEGFRARAELRPPFPMDELKQAWVEVVDDEHRPVRSERLRRMRRALRWADAALRAEQQPQGLAPQFTSEDWIALATGAWEHCAAEWAETGDRDRAYLATRRIAALTPAARVPKAPSAWAADLADRPQLREPAFLAEALGIELFKAPR
jgi:hypothetical protein